MGRAEIERNPDLLRQALKRAARVELPIVARSHTEAENAAHERRGFSCAAYGLALFVVWLPLALAFDGDPQRFRDALNVTPVSLVLLAGVAWALKWRRGRRSDYVDPRIVIEIGPERLLLTVGESVRDLVYDAAPGRIAHLRSSRGMNFAGLVLDGPSRPIALVDVDMLNGRDAAAALLGCCVRAGSLNPPD
jgi:hypothetical protein